MSDPVTRLNTALEGRYAIERELGEGGRLRSTWPMTSSTNAARLRGTASFPALTVSAGFTTDELPVGLEFLGRPFTEEMLLGLGYAFEQATRHRRPPPNTPRLERP